MGKKLLEGFQCERCGYTWIKRRSTEGDPVLCPGCKSPYWNKPRVKKKEQKKSIKKNI